MMLKIFVQLVLVILLSCNFGSPQDLDSVINELAKKIADAQVGPSWIETGNLSFNVYTEHYLWYSCSSLALYIIDILY